ncbi:MAG: hypothetical protein LDLANPLL_02600 [Turneriella sp.]|nr:hypothetical protein [Turneriella sp.]
MIEFLPEQIPVLATLGRAALTGLFPKNEATIETEIFSKEVVTEINPPSAKLVAAYVKSCGGDAADYKDTIPFHLFPQWGFPPLMQTLADLPFSLTRIMNGGCTVRMGKSLVRDGKLTTIARLASVDKNERRIILNQELETHDRHANVIFVTQTAIVPLKSEKKANGNKPKKREPVLVSEESYEVASFYAHETSGLEYAFYSGDFNPIHWLLPYAKLSGFKRPILHGFAQLGRVYEGLRKNIYCGKIDPLSEISIRFERPLVLPQACRVFLTEKGEFFIGQAKGAIAVASGYIRT